ncbi:class I SAM-dependent methyltransferase [bacterium]|nr:class I SAM-dependent methyltransferase [bacterium]
MKRWFPRPYRWLRRFLSPYWWPIPQLWRSCAGRVSSGPFQGMLYLPEVEGSRLAPKLLGSYECELHPVIEKILEARPSLVVDIGCGEGYYAVGLARALPEARVVAYDISAEARRLCSQLAALNQVGLEIRGHCDLNELSQFDLKGALIFCDCEGAELELLRPDRLPGLAQATVVVETHDCILPGITAQLQARFKTTHQLEWLPVQARRAEDYPILATLSPLLQRFALAERSEEQAWGYFVPDPDQAVSS